MDPCAHGQAMFDHAGLEARNQDEVVKGLRQAGDALHHRLAQAAPDFSRIVAGIAMGRPAGRRQGRQLADVVFLVVVEAAIGAEHEIFVHRIDGRQARLLDRPGDRGRKRLGPAMDMDDGFLARQAREQLAHFRLGLKIPGSLHGGGGLGGIAEQVSLIEADDFHPGLGKARIDRRGGGENDRIVAGLFQPERAFQRHLGLPAGDRGMIDRDDNIDARPFCAHECASTQEIDGASVARKIFRKTDGT